MVKSPMFHVTNYQRVCHNPQESLNRPQRLVGGQTDPQRHRDPTKMMGGSTKKKCLLHQPFDGDLSKSGWAKWGKLWQMMGFSPVWWPQGGKLLEKCPMVGSEHISVSLKSLEIWPKSDGDKSFLATVSPQTSPLKYRLEHCRVLPSPPVLLPFHMPIPIGSYWCHLERPVESHDFGLFGW